MYIRVYKLCGCWYKNEIKTVQKQYISTETVQKRYISTKTIQKRNTNGTKTEQKLYKSNVQNDKRGFHQRALKLWNTARVMWLASCVC